MFLFGKEKLYGPKGLTPAQKRNDTVSTFGWKEGEYMLFWNSEVVYCAIALDGIFYKPSADSSIIRIPVPDVASIECLDNPVSKHHGYNWGRVALHLTNGNTFEIELPLSELPSFEKGWGETPLPQFYDFDPAYSNQGYVRWALDDYPEQIIWRSKYNDIAIAYITYEDADTAFNLDPSLQYASICYRIKDENGNYPDIYVPLAQFESANVSNQTFQKDGMEWVDFEILTLHGTKLLMALPVHEFDEFFGTIHKLFKGE